MALGFGPEQVRHSGWGNRIRRYSLDCTGAVGSPCLIHAGRPVKQIRIKLTCVQHGVRICCEKHSDSCPRESNTFTNECHCFLPYTLWCLVKCWPYAHAKKTDAPGSPRTHM